MELATRLCGFAVLLLGGVPALFKRHWTDIVQRLMSHAVLLSHSPLATELAASKGVDFMLSGHTHGGQIWPFGYLVMLRFPLLAGEYDVEGLKVIVSRGTGTWGPRPGLWHPAEILRVTLHSQSSPPTLNESSFRSKLAVTDRAANVRFGVLDRRRE